MSLRAFKNRSLRSDWVLVGLAAVSFLSVVVIVWTRYVNEHVYHNEIQVRLTAGVIQNLTATSHLWIKDSFHGKPNVATESIHRNLIDCAALLDDVLGEKNVLHPFRDPQVRSNLRAARELLIRYTALVLLLDEKVESPRPDDGTLETLLDSLAMEFSARISAFDAVLQEHASSHILETTRLYRAVLVAWVTASCIFLALFWHLEKRRRNAEQRLRKSEESHRTLSENLPGIVYRAFLGENVRMQFYNAMVEPMTGYSAEELNQGGVCSMEPLILPEDKSMAVNTARDAVANDQPFQLEYRIRHKNGETRSFLERGKPIRGPHGNPLYIDGIILDVTKRKEAEELVENVLEVVREGFVILDPDYKILSANKAYCRQVNMPLEAIKGKHCYEISHRIDAPCYENGEFCTTRAAFASGESHSAIHIHPDLDGRPLYVEINAYPIKNPAGRTVSVIETMKDVTDNMHLKEQLIQSQKMEAIGNLAGGIAHDFNNLLTAIIGYGNLLKTKIGNHNPAKQDVAQILAAADRGTHLTRSLLTFSRKQVAKLEPANLNEIVRSVENLLCRVIGEDIVFTVRMTEDDLMIVADNRQVEQVLLNLASNARDAMPQGGQLTLKTDRVELSREFINRHGYGARGEYALLSVADTGAGMDEITQERIFEPFFTTKDLGKGTGLGLSIVYGIIKQHKGHIHVSSEVGKGTAFEVYFPLVHAEVGRTETTQRTPPQGGTERVLIGEDDEQVRELISQVLKDSGYEVICAVDGEDAIEKFRDNRGRLRLIILDVIMPKKNGKTVYDEIKAENPDIKALFISGHTVNIIQTKAVLDAGLNFLSKPVLPNELLKKVREILDHHCAV